MVFAMVNAVIHTNSLIVDNNTYQSASFGKMLQIFGIEQLTIASAQVTLDGGGSKNFAITGNVEIFSTTIEGIELYLDFVSEQTFQFQLTGILPSLKLSTIRAQQILPNNDLTNISDLLDTAFQNVKLVFDSERNEIYFGLLQSSFQLTFLAAIGLSLNKIGFEFLRGYDENRAALRIYAVIKMGSKLIDTTVRVPLGGALSANNLTLTVNSVIQLSSGLQDLITFLEGTNTGKQIGVSSFADIFPEQLHQIPTLFMKDLEIQFNPFVGRLICMAFQVESVHPFQIGDGLFAIDDVGLRMFIDLTNPGFSLTVYGSIKVKEDASIDITVQLPQNFKQDNWVLTMEAVLYIESVNDIVGLPINTPFGELSLPDALLTISDLRLNLFEVDFNPINKTVASILLDVAFYAECDISDLKVSNPRLTLNITKPFNQSSLDKRKIDGMIAGTIAVGDINFSLKAEKNGTTWSFTCATEPGAIPIGRMIAALGQQFNIQLPDALNGITLENLSLTFSTTSGSTAGANKSSSLTFTCEGKFPVESEEVDIVVNIEVQKVGNTHTRTLSGHVTVGTRQFQLIFSEDNTSTFFIAAYDNQSGEKIKIKEDLVAHISANAAQYIPEGLEIDFKDILFVFSKRTTDTSDVQSTFLFGLDISVNIPSLSNLPLVGRELPADQTIKVDDLQLLVASKAIKQDSVTSLNALIPDGVTKLLGTDLGAGLNLSASMNFGGSPQILAVPVVSAGAAASPAPAPAPSPAAGVTSADNAKWFTLQKSFGPVHFNRVGVKYQDATVFFLLDASLMVAVLTLSLDDLAFGSPLSKFDPKFDLHGLGLDYQSGPAEIGGAFLRTQGKLPDGTTYDEYDGAAVIKTEELTLSALGSYAVLHDNPSLFIYAVLDYPLGGPSFFFITGLAAGFGYNRSLIVPPVDQIAQFPLVAAAVNGATPPQNVKDLTAELALLDQYIHPEIGEIFFAIGIKFTSFKIIDSFVLLTIAFGNELEINVLGLSTMTQPPPVPGEPAVTPLAVVEMAVKASFIPAQGFLGISAQLTSASYIISTSCQLTGGFAFYTWFAGIHSGEFVQTLGGYHPSFIVPDYYPCVPRLGYNWQVDDQLSIKGGAYFALTASLLMAGLQVQANWNSGNLQVWFNVALDFIIAWKPFHYDATAHLDLGASYTFDFFGTHHLTFDVGADLHIWGPEFSGQAHINLDIISFDISFGDSSAQQPSPIGWPTFKQSFLPSDAAICGISVTNGLISKQSQDASDLGVINPKYFVLTTNSLIPSSRAHIHNDIAVSQVYYTENGTLASFKASSANGNVVQVQPAGAKMKAIGSLAIGPMGIQSGQFTSTHTIVISRDGTNVELDFAYTPILKNVPVGMWGQSLNPSLNGQRCVDDALSGFEIRPMVQSTPGETAPIDSSNLQYEPETVQPAYSWTQAPLTFQPDSLNEPQRRQTISTSIVAPATVAARQQLCTALGVNTESIDLNQAIASTVANTFLFAPQVEKV